MNRKSWLLVSIPFLVAFLVASMLVGCAKPAPAPAPKPPAPAPAPTPTPAPTTPAAAPTPAPAPKPTPTPTPEAKVFKYGYTAALSGSGASWGIPLQRGHLIGAEHINDTGGIKVGGQTYKVEIVSYDDKYTSEGGVSAANKFVFQDKINYLYNMGTAPTLAAKPITEANKVLMYTQSIHNDAVGPYIVRGLLSGAEAAKPSYGWLTKTYPNMKKVALVAQNDPTGKGASVPEKGAISFYNLNLVAEQYYEPGTTDFYPVLTKVMAAGPDLIDLDASTPASAGAISKQVRELGFKGMLYVATNADLGALLTVGGAQGVEGLISFGRLFGKPGASAAEMEFYKRFSAKWDPLTLSTAVAAVYDWLHMLRTVIEKTQTFDTTTVINTMVDMEFKDGMVLGTTRFGVEKTYGLKRQELYPLSLWQVRSGDYVKLAEIPLTE